VVGSFAALTVLPLVIGLWVVFSLVRDLPDKDAVQRIGTMDQATTVYDGADKPVFTIFKEQRTDVPLSEISPNLTRALIAIEDQRFYEHRGFDIYRIGAAAWADLRHRRVAQGASTITQQLVRQSFLKPEKTFRRKLQELILAGRIEQLYSKSQILELYLNNVYFGDGRYGVEAASRGYFGKPAAALSVAEAAMLAGLVKSPSSYAPTVNMERATGRRNVVLQSMLDAGAIDKPTWQKARSSKIVLTNTVPAQEAHGQYFKEEVRQELVERFGWQRVYQSGLRVFSTIDMAAQQHAEEAVHATLTTLTGRRAAIASKSKRPSSDEDDPLQAALIALDPHTGHVLAMVGGRDFDESHFNRAVQAKRQPGSAFKPFVYATALEMGYSPATVLTNLNDPIATPKGGWTPEDEHSPESSMTLRTALRTSSNRAAVTLLQRVGIARTVEYAKNMGVGEMPAVPSLALGSGEVTLQSMTAAYAAFANQGLVPKPIVIRRVEDRDGHVLFQDDSVPKRAIKETTAFLISNMLADVINAGTGARARTLGFKLPAAGKTGTTNDFNDAWFVGFTPRLVTGVWVGFDQPRTILPRGFAAEVAVPLWTAFMKSATAGDKPDWFSPPAGITTATVCRMSGKLAADRCKDVEVIVDDHVSRRSMVYTEYFVRGTEPRMYCDLHEPTGVLGRIAGLFGGGEKPPPPRIDDVLPPRPSATVAVGSSGHAETETTATETRKPQKRGFWGRLFGRGGNDKDKNKNEDPASRPRR
jgi:1A family penicillin-binding protein